MTDPIPDADTDADGDAEFESRLEALFLAAMDAPSPEARQVVVDGIEDPGLRDRVVALIGAANVDGPQIDRLAETAAQSVVATQGAGTLIGPYTLIEPIGDGGFGTVWRARQDEPMRREVALKLIKPGMDSRAVLERFEIERRVLATLDHPNIARVLDAGLTPAGRPYFAMELIKGESIVDWCDHRRLDTEARLRLFIPVCRAIQHAHQRGVIHRDVKPSNVLVSEHDGRGVPKVIDFGIARAVETSDADRTRLTIAGQLVGTPEYMSPEQASMDPGAIDTRSDVYGLGVLLYELLVGRPPFDPETLRLAGWGEMLRIIRENDPQRPSTRFESRGSDSRGAAISRGADERRVREQLRGELDWIAMCCLEKEKDRRYPSADALAEDIERALRHEPVSAGPPGVAYRTRTFVRRHRVGVGAGVAVVAALVLGLLGTARGMRDARAASREAEAGWSKAREEEAAARAANAELSRVAYATMMQLASAAVADGDRASARALLDSAPEAYRGWEHAHLSARVGVVGMGLEASGGRALALVAGDEHRVHRLGRTRIEAWDTIDGRRLYSRSVPAGPASEYGSLLVAEGDTLLTMRTRIDEQGEGYVQVAARDAATGQLRDDLPPHRGQLGDVVPGVTGGRCAFVVRVGNQWRLAVVEPSSGDLIREVDLPADVGPTWQVRTCAINDDGTIVAVNHSRAQSGLAPDHPDLSRILLVRVSDGAITSTDIVGQPLGFTALDELVTLRAESLQRHRITETGTELIERFPPDGGPPQYTTTGPGWIATALPRGGVRVRNLVAGTVHDVPGATNASADLRFAVDLEAGRLIVSEPDRTRLIAIGPGGEPWIVTRTEHPIRGIEILPDGTRFVMFDWSGWFGSEPGSLSVREVTGGQPELERLEALEVVHDAAIHPSRPILVTKGIGRPRGRVLEQASVLRGWNLKTGTIRWEREIPAGMAWNIAFLPDGRFLDAAEDGLHVCDPEDGRILKTISATEGKSARLPVPLGDSRVLLFLRESSQILVVDVDSAAAERTFDVDLALPKQEPPAVHPDGRLVAFPGGDRPQVTVVDVETGRIVASPGPHVGRVMSVCFTRDGSRLLTGDDSGGIRIFETEHYELVGVLEGHEGLVRDIEALPDGRTILSAGADGTVRRWSLETWSERMTALGDL